jgi:outer membrane protein
MRMVARLLFAAPLLFVPVSARAQASAAAIPSPTGVRLACVSLQRAFSESTDGKVALARLTALQAERTRAIEDKNRALRTQEQALERSAPVLSESARAQRTIDVQKFRVDVQRMIEDAQVELTGVQRDAEKTFAIKLKPAIAKVAQDMGFQIVFNIDEGLVAWFDPSLDITPQVVRQIASK